MAVPNTLHSSWQSVVPTKRYKSDAVMLLPFMLRIRGNVRIEFTIRLTIKAGASIELGASCSMVALEAQLPNLVLHRCFLFVKHLKGKGNTIQIEL